MKELARSVKSISGIDLLYEAVLKWGDPSKSQVRSSMALLLLTWKEAKHEYHMMNLADWLGKLMTAQHELGVAGQAIGDKVRVRHDGARQLRWWQARGGLLMPS